MDRMIVSYLFQSKLTTLKRSSSFIEKSWLSSYDTKLELPIPCEGYSIHDSYNIVVLGDLHLEEDNMKIFEDSRSDCINALKKMSLLCSGALSEEKEMEKVELERLIENIKMCRAGDLTIKQLEMLLERKRNGELMKCHMVSLGDLGRKEIRHDEGDPGTLKSFTDALSFFRGFGIPFEVVTGNHDLEGLDEFDTDEDNLNAFLCVFDKSTPQFSKQISDKTLLVGLSTVRFRDSPFSSHECHIDDQQLSWFRNVIESHSQEDGWKIFVFSHAPIMGSGLRVLQNVHVVNGCAWLNHCSPNRNSFIQIVKNNPQIKLWFSGHFHLSHDYQDSIYTVGNCTFVQAGVIGPLSSRDTRRQTRLVRGNQENINIYSINHHKRNPDAEIRLDATIDLITGEVKHSLGHDDYTHENWFKAYIPQMEDGCYIDIPEGQIACKQTVRSSVCWWHMHDGAVLGLHEGQLVEYDKETLSPLGIVVNKKQMASREVLVIQQGTVLMLVNEDRSGLEVVHPNEDGSYWRKVQRNKRVRQEEKAREDLAKEWLGTN